jgi:hypothetical protein
LPDQAAQHQDDILCGQVQFTALVVFQRRGQAVVPVAGAGLYGHVAEKQAKLAAQMRLQGLKRAADR